MNRLTKQDAYWVGEEFWTSAEEPDDDEIDKVYMRLKAYEDTGLMPEEVKQMRDERCWVPLMERPPKDGQEVWVSTKMGGVYLATYHESYGVCERSVFLLNFGIIQVDDVTAWQPSNPPNAYTPATKQNNPSGWQEQMMGAFLGDSRL